MIATPKSLFKPHLELLCNKLGLSDMYSPAWGERHEIHHFDVSDEGIFSRFVSCI